MRARPLIPWLIVVGLVLAGHVAWIDDGPCGQDAWILVEASRVDGPGDLMHLLTQELRDGVRPSTAFYRPLVNLSFAVDGGLFPGSWRALHVSSLLLHLAASLALALLALRLGVRRAIALAAGLVFALHPLSVEVVPAPARRGESLVLLLLLLSSVALVDASRRRGGWVLALALGALAPLAKEVGFLLPLLWAALPLELSRRRRALAGTLAVLPVLLIRSLVLGGEGGYGGGWSFSSAGLVDAFVDLADPFRLYGGWGARALVLMVAGAASMLLLRRMRDHEGRESVVGAGLLWWAAPMLLVTLARGIAPWYLYVPLAGWCLMGAGVAQGAFSELVGRRRALAGGVVVVALLPLVGGSPLLHDYPEWAIAGQQSRRTLEAALGHVDAWAGTTVRVVGLPREVQLLPRPRYYVRSATALSADALRRYVELRTGRSADVRSLADVVLTADGPWHLRCNPVDERDVVLRTEGPAAFLAPMWPEPDARPIPAGALELRLPLAGRAVWLFDGEEWSVVASQTGAGDGS